MASKLRLFFVILRRLIHKTKKIKAWKLTKKPYPWAFLPMYGYVGASTNAPSTENVQPALNNQPQLIEKVERTPNSVNIPYEKWRLPNGLTVILLEDHSDPIVNVEIAYHVGSDREAPGKSGFAHLFEHMLFQGSEHVKDEEHFKIVSEAGGSREQVILLQIVLYILRPCPAAIWKQPCGWDQTGWVSC